MCAATWKRPGNTKQAEKKGIFAQATRFWQDRNEAQQGIEEKRNLSPTATANLLPQSVEQILDFLRGTAGDAAAGAQAALGQDGRHGQGQSV